MFADNGTWVVQRSVEMEKPIVSFSLETQPCLSCRTEKHSARQIFVSINYRVAAYGFLNSPALEKEGNQNLGLYDQRLAMHWVQENIGSFGGDKSKVTIWGERYISRSLQKLDSDCSDDILSTTVPVHFQLLGIY